MRFDCQLKVESNLVGNCALATQERSQLRGGLPEITNFYNRWRSRSLQNMFDDDLFRLFPVCTRSNHEPFALPCLRNIGRGLPCLGHAPGGRGQNVQHVSQRVSLCH